MIAQDARWTGDVLLSTSHHRVSAAVALSLFSHSSGIVPEGGRFIRSAEPSKGLSALTDLLPSEFAAVIQQAGHADKLVGDNQRFGRYGQLGILK